MNDLFEQNKTMVMKKYEETINRKNVKSDFYNGIYDRYKYPVLTRDHIPPFWKFDMNPETNPYFMERLGVNCVFNAGAIELDGKFYLVARVEGNDRKSFFAVAESDNGIDGIRESAGGVCTFGGNNRGGEAEAGGWARERGNVLSAGKNHDRCAGEAGGNGGFGD